MTGRNTVTAQASIEMESGNQDIIARITASIDDIPPMPQVVIKAQQLLTDPNSSPKEVAALLENDQSIATKVLKMANSAFYGLSGMISSIQHAALVLGYHTLSEIIATAGTQKMLERKLPGYGFESEDLWRHSISVGMGAKIIAADKNSDLAFVAHTAGLIHDVGKLILDPFVLEHKDAIDSFLEDEQQTFLSAEKQVLGYDHAEIAAEICKIWNIPDIIATPIRYHHAPSASKGDELAYMLHMADYATIMSGGGYDGNDFMYELEEGTMDFLGFEQGDISELTLEVMESLDQLAAFPH